MNRLAVKLLAAISLLVSAASMSAQDWAKATLEKSPRHREYVPIKHGDRTVQAFVVYPEVSRRAPVVLLIHEIFGLSDWAKEMADELAAQGYIVVAPDLLSGFGPGGGGSDAFPSQDGITKAVSGLNADVVTADLDAAADYGKSLPSANGKLFVAGFCWGGGKSFVFYGPAPAEVASITAPVYGFYAGNDARITATVPGTVAVMKAAGKKYDPVTYDGAGHGFMRGGEDPAADAANKKARDEGFKRLVTLIDKWNAGTASRVQRPVRGGAAQKPVVAAVSCHEGTSARNVDAGPGRDSKSDGRGAGVAAEDSSSPLDIAAIL